MDSSEDMEKEYEPIIKIDYSKGAPSNRVSLMWEIKEELDKNSAAVSKAELDGTASREKVEFKNRDSTNAEEHQVKSEPPENEADSVELRKQWLSYNSKEELKTDRDVGDKSIGAAINEGIAANQSTSVGGQPLNFICSDDWPLQKSCSPSTLLHAEKVQIEGFAKKKRIHGESSDCLPLERIESHDILQWTPTRCCDLALFSQTSDFGDKQNKFSLNRVEQKPFRDKIYQKSNIPGTILPDDDEEQPSNYDSRDKRNVLETILPLNNEENPSNLDLCGISGSSFPVEEQKITNCDDNNIFKELISLNTRASGDNTSHKYDCPMLTNNESSTQNISAKCDSSKSYDNEQSPSCSSAHKKGNSNILLVHHFGRSRFSCKFCDKMFLKASYLARHQKTHDFPNLSDSDESKSSPSHPRKAANSKSQLAVQLSKEHFPCELCNKEFSKASYLARHVKTHTEAKPHQCELCGKRLKNKTSLKRHMLNHAKEKPFQCESCQKRFATKPSFTAHRLSHVAERPHKCGFCGKRFKSHYQLIGHSVAHSTDKPYQCDLCDRQFLRRSTLTQHMVTHTKEKPHRCLHCDKTFAQRAYLTLHIRTHTKERPFQCQICGKSFADKSNLTGHIKIHSNEKPYECDVCLKTFSVKAYLAKHFKKCHKSSSMYIKL